MSKPITLAITGASGAQYGLRLLECLLGAGCQVYLLLSSAARVVIATELEEAWPQEPQVCGQWLTERFGAASGQLVVCDRLDWFSPVASGSASSPDEHAASTRAATTPIAASAALFRIISASSIRTPAVARRQAFSASESWTGSPAPAPSAGW